MIFYNIAFNYRKKRVYHILVLKNYILYFLWLIYKVSQETWQLVNSLKCLLPWFVKLFNSKIDFKVKDFQGKDFFNWINCKKPLTFHTVYGIRHSSLFTNYSWDTLYIINTNIFKYKTAGKSSIHQLRTLL